MGRLQTAGEAALLAARVFEVDQETQPVLEAQVGVLGVLELLLQAGAHATQAQGGELVEQGLDEHGVTSGQ